jgi:hypothetical protein
MIRPTRWSVSFRRHRHRRRFRGGVVESGDGRLSAPDGSAAFDVCPLRKSPLDAIMVAMFGAPFCRI